MKIAIAKSDITETLSCQRQEKGSIALVPTMGNLHQGHISLIENARKNSDFVVCSIFVNPMQFGINEDLDAYPRTLDADIKKLEAAGCDLLFTPEVNEIYANGLNQETAIHVPILGENYCGRSRPGHFDGVSTVVAKLFNIVQPDQAYFGLKDYQQFLIIKKMAIDLAFPINIIGVPIVRESNGLAMSSRNNYLSEKHKEQASNLFKTLLKASDELSNGSRDFSGVENSAKRELSSIGLEPDYFSICAAENLQPATKETQTFAILAAVNIGNTRLIDNVQVAI